MQQNQTTIHISSWLGDMAVNDVATPTMLKIHLRTQAKLQPIGKGVDMFVGQSCNELCPIDTIVAYTVVRGNATYSSGQKKFPFCFRITIVLRFYRFCSVPPEIV